MAYTPNEWKNVAGVGLNRWRDQNNNVLILTHDPLSIEELGTPFSAEWMNHLEIGVKEIHDIFGQDQFDMTKGLIGDSTILRFDFEGPGEAIRFLSKARATGGAAGNRIALQTAYPTSVDDESDMYSSVFLYDGNDKQRITLQAWTGNYCGLGVRDANENVRAKVRYGPANDAAQIAIQSAAGQDVVEMFENAGNGQIRIRDAGGTIRGDFWVNPAEGNALVLFFNEPPTFSGSANVVFAPQVGGGYQLCRETSLRKYKRNIENIGNTGAAVDALRAVRYKPLDADAEQIGLIAEEVEAAFPALASYGAHGELAGVNYDRVAVLLLADAQETHRRLKKIEEELGIC